MTVKLQGAKNEEETTRQYQILLLMLMLMLIEEIEQRALPDWESDGWSSQYTRAHIENKRSMDKASGKQETKSPL